MVLMQRSVALSQRYPQLHLNQGYTLSDLHWFMGDYERAIPLQRAYLSGTKREAFRAFCGWKLVFALWMTRSKDTAEMHALCTSVIEQCALPCFHQGRACVLTCWSFADSKETESYDRFSARKCRQFLATKGAIVLCRGFQWRTIYAMSRSDLGGRGADFAVRVAGGTEAVRRGVGTRAERAAARQVDGR